MGEENRMENVVNNTELSDEQIAQVSGGNSLENMIRERLEANMRELEIGTGEHCEMREPGEPIIVSDKTSEEAMREYVQSNPLVQRCEDLLRHR